MPFCADIFFFLVVAFGVGHYRCRKSHFTTLASSGGSVGENGAIILAIKDWSTAHSLAQERSVGDSHDNFYGEADDEHGTAHFSERRRTRYNNSSFLIQKVELAVIQSFTNNTETGHRLSNIT